MELASSLPLQSSEIRPLQGEEASHTAKETTGTQGSKGFLYDIGVRIAARFSSATSREEGKSRWNSIKDSLRNLFSGWTMPSFASKKENVKDGSTSPIKNVKRVTWGTDIIYRISSEENSKDNPTVTSNPKIPSATKNSVVAYIERMDQGLVRSFLKGGLNALRARERGGDKKEKPSEGGAANEASSLVSRESSPHAPPAAPTQATVINEASAPQDSITQDLLQELTPNQMEALQKGETVIASATSDQNIRKVAVYRLIKSSPEQVKNVFWDAKKNARQLSSQCQECQVTNTSGVDSQQKQEVDYTMKTDKGRVFHMVLEREYKTLPDQGGFAINWSLKGKATTKVPLVGNVTIMEANNGSIQVLPYSEGTLVYYRVSIEAGTRAAAEMTHEKVAEQVTSALQASVTLAGQEVS